MFGDKVKARKQAELDQISVIPGSDGPVNSLTEAIAFGEQVGYPVMIKAALGGGRGMRIVRDAKEMQDAFERAKSEAKAAFGNNEVYIEKLIENPKH